MGPCDQDVFSLPKGVHTLPKGVHTLPKGVHVQAKAGQVREMGEERAVVRGGGRGSSKMLFELCADARRDVCGRASAALAPPSLAFGACVD